MGDIGLAATAALPVVSLLSVVVGPPDQIDLVGGQVVRQTLGQQVDAGRVDVTIRRLGGHGLESLAVRFFVDFEGGEQRLFFDDVVKTDDFFVDQTFGDLAQGDHGTLGSLPPVASWRERLVASMTSSNRLSTLSRQSSTVTRAMVFLVAMMIPGTGDPIV